MVENRAIGVLTTHEQFGVKHREMLGDETGRFIYCYEPNGVQCAFLEYRFGSLGTTEIVNIQVDEQMRALGIGRAMVSLLSQDPRVKVLFAFTSASNHGAHKFYRRLGFTLTPVPCYYGVGHDAFIAVSQVRS